MATDYGADLRALDDIPSSDDYVTGEDAAAYACARRLLTEELSDCGDEAEYASLDIRRKIGAHLDTGDRRILEADVRRALAGEEMAQSVTSAVTFGDRSLDVSFSGTAAAGPFSGVLSIDALTGADLVTT